MVYQDQKNYKKAFAIFDELYAKAPKKDYKSRARYLDNLAFTEWLENRDVDISLKLNQAQQWRKELNDYNDLTASYYHLSEFYKNLNNVKAIDYAEEWLESGEVSTSLQSQVNALKQLLVLNPSDTKYISAYVQLSDSLNKLNLKAKNTFAKIRLDEEQKQQQISSLEASTAVQALENQKIKTRNYIFGFFAILVIGLAILIFYYKRQKHRRDKITEIYNTETRISKKIHDELANDVYNIMSGLETVVPAEIIDKLESIYSRTRDISRENSNINTGQGYGSQLVALLSNVCPHDTRLIINGEKNIPWSSINREKKFVIYRVLQEIMVNMKKYSQASLVALVFSEEAKYLRIHYSDNGKGSTLEAIQNGNGIQNMDNRISSVNGKLIFELEKGKGLKIMISIPL